MRILLRHLPRFVAAAALCLASVLAHAQSAPSWISYGYVPSAGDYRSAFSSKQDVLRYTPLNTTGGTMAGRLQTAPSTINGAGFSVLSGIAPTTPSNGDVWTTQAGFFIRANGQTVNLATLSSGTMAQQNANAVAITGGTINGTTIGGTTPAPGAFTTATIGGFAISGVGTAAGTVAAGNDSRIVGAVQQSGLSASLDTAFGSTQGGILYRGASAWSLLTPGTSGQVLQTGGSAANPSWLTLPTASTLPPVGQVRLSYSSATALLAKPYNGNLVTINGVQQTVPSAGVTCSNTGLTQATLYYAYLYMVSSTVTCEMVATTHATGTNGVEIKSGDATRTLVGMAYTGTGTPGVFVDSATQRFVASWFNRQDRIVLGAATVSGTTSTSTTEINTGLRISFISWADEAPDLGANGYVYNDTAGQSTQSVLAIDGAVTVQGSNSHSSSGGYAGNSALKLRQSVAEGMHYATIMGSCNGGTGRFAVQINGGVRS